jgi:uncharacterized membrane protein YraQ (UPF0718 family)
MFATLSIILISALSNAPKTWQGLQKGLNMLLKILPPLITIIILISVFLGFVSQDMLIKYLGKEAGFGGVLLAALLGSIALIPGFIAYPLGMLLLHNGVSYEVIAVFITTLMMVGILTLPIEIRYFGVKVSLLRNGLSFLGALLIGVLMGMLL